MNIQGRGDLVLTALEFGVGDNATATQLAMIKAEWGALLFDNSFSMFASQAVRLASKWDRLPDKMPSQQRDKASFVGEFIEKVRMSSKCPELIAHYLSNRTKSLQDLIAWQMVLENENHARAKRRKLLNRQAGAGLLADSASMASWDGHGHPSGNYSYSNDYN